MHLDDEENSNVVSRLRDASLSGWSAILKKISWGHKLAIIWMLLDFLQLVSFAFAEQGSHWEAAWLNSYMHPFTIVIYETSIRDGNFIYFYLSLSIFFITAGFTFYVILQHMKGREKSNEISADNQRDESEVKEALMYATAGLNMLISSLFYMPILASLLTLSDHIIQENGTSMWWAAGFVYMIAIAFFLFTLAFAATAHNVDPASDCVLARPHTRIDMINHLIRTSLVIMHVNLHNELLFSFIFVALSLYQAYISTKFLPYYRFGYSQFRSMLFWLNGWTSLCLILSIRQPEGDIAAVVLLFMGLPLVLSLSFLAAYSRRVQVATADVRDLHTPFEIEMKGRFYLLDVQYNLLREAEKNNVSCEKRVLREEDYATVESWYFTGSKMFNQNATLFLHWSLYHFFYDMNHQMASGILAKVETRSPQPDETFLIFRMRKIAEKTLVDGSASVLAYMAYQKHLNLAQYYDVISSEARLKFWEALLEPNPDLVHLHAIGADINQSTENARKHYQEMMKLHNSSPNELRLYASFLADVENDPEKANVFAIRADEIERTRAKTQSHFQVRSRGGMDIDVFDDRNSVIIISGQPKNIGTILQINAAGCKVFGYSQSEVVGKNISSLLPNPFSQLHDQFLHSYISTGKGSVINNTRMLFGLRKSGHIFPIQLHVRQVSGEVNSAAFLGALKELQTDDEYIFVIGDGDASHWTVGCQKLFRELDSMEKTVPIDEVIPDYTDLKEEFLTREGGHAVLPRGNYNQKIQVWVDVIDVHGIRVEIVRVQEGERVHLDGTPMETVNEMSINPEFALYTMDGTDDQSDVSDTRKPRNLSFAIPSPRGNSQVGEHKYNAGPSPRGSRNLGGNVGPASVTGSHKREDDRSILGKSNVRSVHSNRSRGTNVSGTSMDAVRRIVLSKKSSVNDGLSTLKKFFFMTLVVVIISIVSSYVASNILLQRYSDDMDSVMLAGDRFFAQLGIATDTRTLNLVHLNIFTVEEEEDIGRATLLLMADRLEETELALYTNAEHVFDGFEEMYETPNIDVVELSGSIEHHRYMNLHEVATVLISKARLIHEQPISEIDLMNENVHFILTNNFGSVETAFNDSSRTYQKQAVKDASLVESIDLIFTCVALVVVFLVLVLAFRPAVRRVEGNKEVVLNLFLDIPRETVKELHKSSERRFRFLQDETNALGDDEDDEFGPQGNIDEEANPDNPLNRDHKTVAEEREMRRGSQKRSTRRSGVMLRISIIFFVSAAYFLGTFFWSYSFVESTKGESYEITWSARRASSAYRTFFITREYFVETNITKREELRADAIHSIEYSQWVHRGILYGDATMHTPGSVRRSTGQDNILFENACTHTSSPGCEDFYDGIMTHGLDSALNEFDRIAMMLLSVDHDIDLLHEEEFILLETMARTYLEEALKESEHLYVEELQDKLSSFLDLRLIIVLIVIALLLCLMYFLYIPLINSLYKDSSRTRAMLLIIPINVMEHVKSIRNFIKSNATSI